MKKTPKTLLTTTAAAFLIGGAGVGAYNYFDTHQEPQKIEVKTPNSKLCFNARSE